MKKQMVKDMRVGDEVETQVMVVEVNRARFSAPHRAGDHFLKLTLADVSGRIKAVMWDPPRGDEEVKDGDVIFVRGSVGEYHGPQVVVGDLRKLDPEKVNRAFFQPVSARRPEEMMAELNAIINKDITSRHLNCLMMAFFDDAGFARSFASSPAARSVHHNYVGGLLEHTLEVIGICRYLAGLYPVRIRLDLLLSGAILHDIGKIEEYRSDSLSFEFTDRGKLVGHISIGKEMLDRKIAGLNDFPPDLKLELEHMLLSHHGSREWGSPEIPKTIHAYCLFHADLLSARMNQFDAVMRNHPPGSGDWTDWDRFLERSVFMSSTCRNEEEQ